MTDRPLSYWVAVARMGFENDLHRLLEMANITRAQLADQLSVSGPYVSKVLNGTAGNYQLETMAKWARALGAIVQIRLVKEGKEVVRVVDYETAGALDDKQTAPSAPPTSIDTSSDAVGKVLQFHPKRASDAVLIEAVHG